jgi:hypothetical protein
MAPSVRIGIKEGEPLYVRDARLPIIAAYAFSAAFIAVQIWLAATILLRLSEDSYVRAALWSCVLAFLVNIDANWR